MLTKDERRRTNACVCAQPAHTCTAHSRMCSSFVSRSGPPSARWPALWMTS